jgi:cytochrome bd-type quinol oxidase subunit 1
MAKPKKLTDLSEKQTSPAAVFKVKFAVKASAFCASVITLSWFFEGWRKIHEALNPASIGILAAGTLCTLGLLAIQSFWIYAEEKQKGSLVREIPLFDLILEKLLAKRANAAACADGTLLKGSEHV